MDIPFLFTISASDGRMMLFLNRETGKYEPLTVKVPLSLIMEDKGETVVVRYINYCFGLRVTEKDVLNFAHPEDADDNAPFIIGLMCDDAYDANVVEKLPSMYSGAIFLHTAQVGMMDDSLFSPDAIELFKFVSAKVASGVKDVSGEEMTPDWMLKSFGHYKAIVFWEMAKDLPNKFKYVQIRTV